MKEESNKKKILNVIKEIIIFLLIGIVVFWIKRS